MTKSCFLFYITGVGLPKISRSSINQIKSRFSYWKTLSKSQKLSLISLLALLFILPVAVIVVLVPKIPLFSGATPVTPPGPSNSISWSTKYAYLKAEDFSIIVDGKKFVDSTPDLKVISDPGDSDYTTLEATWSENDVKMRMSIYFYAEDIPSASEGRQWGVSQIRTFDGTASGGWVFYDHKTPLAKVGQEWSTDELNLFSTSSSKPDISGEIHFRNMQIQAFMPQSTPPPNPTPSSTPPPNPTATSLPTAPPPNPTAVPVPNKVPIIWTRALKMGRVGRKYSSSILALDRDGQKMEMEITGLPNGLEKDRCVFKPLSKTSTIRCWIKGTPKKAGIYLVGVKVTDSWGATTNKNILLAVFSKRFWPRF